MQPALLGGVFIGVLSALPVVNIANCCCIWIIGGGMLAAYLDQGADRAGGLARGALDGLFAGIVGAFVWLLASMAVSSVMAPFQDRLIASLLEGPYDLPPEVRTWFEEAGRGDAGIFGFIFGFMFQLMAGVIFSTLGGVLGALFFWRDNVPPAIGGPQVPPPIPPSL
jgi:hypothetical protein